MSGSGLKTQILGEFTGFDGYGCMDFIKLSRLITNIQFIIFER